MNIAIRFDFGLSREALTSSLRVSQFEWERATNRYTSNVLRHVALEEEDRPKYS